MTGQPGSHVERESTSGGTAVTSEAKPSPGSGAAVSGSVNRRGSSSGGVGWVSP